MLYEWVFYSSVPQPCEIFISMSVCFFVVFFYVIVLLHKLLALFDIRYLVWTLKSCHASDARLSGIAWSLNEVQVVQTWARQLWNLRPSIRIWRFERPCWVRGGPWNAPPNHLVLVRGSPRVFAEPRSCTAHEAMTPTWLVGFLTDSLPVQVSPLGQIDVMCQSQEGKLAAMLVHAWPEQWRPLGELHWTQYHLNL